MKKRILGRLILAGYLLATLLGILPPAQVSAAEQGTCGSNVFWHYQEGVLTISGTGDMVDYGYTASGYTTAPWVDLLKSPCRVVIEEGVINIGDDAFRNCTGITSIEIPESVYVIGEGVFENCKSLTSITLPKGIPWIAAATFDGCTALTSITIPEGVEEIGVYAFADCTALTSITVPASVKTIEGSAFMGCTALTDIELPDTPVSIGMEAFDNTGYFDRTGNWEQDVLYIGNHLVSSRSSLSGAVTIKDGTKTVACHAFSNRTGLTDVTIPESVEYLGKFSFRGCTGLTNVILPEGVKTLDNSAFADCTALRCVNIPASVNSWGDKVFQNDTALVLQLEETNKLARICAQVDEIPFKTYSVQVPAAPVVQEVSLTRVTLEAEAGYEYSMDGVTWQTSPVFGGLQVNKTYTFFRRTAETDTKCVGLTSPGTTVTTPGEYGEIRITFDTFPSYTGSAVTVKPVVTAGGILLTEGEDYHLTYENNVEAGDSAVVTVTMIGDGSETAYRLNFTILKADISQATVSVSDCVYNGKEKTPTPRVQLDGVTLVKDRDYTVYYRNNVAIGRATVQVCGIGNYTGVAIGKFEITKTDSGNSGTLNFNTGSTVTTGSNLTVELDERLFSGYELYHNGIKIDSASGIFGDYLLVFMNTYDPGTYTLRVYTQGYTYLVQGGQYVEKPSGIKTWKSFTVILMGSTTTPDTPEKPTALTPGLPEEISFDTLVLTLGYEPANADIYPVTWTSFNSPVATVDNGILTLHKAGEVMVTARTNGRTATWNLDIEPLNIGKASRIYYDDVAQSVQVIYSGRLLSPGKDYTLEVTSRGNYRELNLTGCGLFGGTMQLCYDPKTDSVYCQGDVNGDLQINSDDAVSLLLHISMPDMFRLPEGVNVDFTGDGTVTTDDAVKLLLHISMPDMFPL